MAVGLLLLPLSRHVDELLLALSSALRFRWGELAARERLSTRLIRGGAVRGALALRREGVERAVDRGGGFELAMATTSYGMVLLPAGWIGEGIEYLRVAAWMTAGWPSNLLRDAVLVSLATGHAFRGEEQEIVNAVSAQDRASATWRARLLALRAQAHLATGAAAEAAADYGAALDAAHTGGERELVIMINNNLAGALIEAGALDQAESRIAAAEALLAPNHPIRAHLLGTRAELALARGDLAAARDWLDRSEAIKTRSGAEGGIGWTLATRARLEAAAGNAAEARGLLDKSVGRLEEMGAVRAWRLAAAAIGDSDAARLAAPAPDPLLDRARALAQPVPNRAWVIHRGIGLGLALGMGFPLFWFASRFQDRLPGGADALTFLAIIVGVLLFGSIFLRRVPRR